MRRVNGFPAPRIPTQKIPDRFSPEDHKEVVAVFKGKHPETGEDLVGLVGVEDFS